MELGTSLGIVGGVNCAYTDRGETGRSMRGPYEVSANQRHGRSEPRPAKLLVIGFQEAAQFAHRHFQFIHAGQRNDADVVWVRPVKRAALYQ